MIEIKPEELREIVGWYGVEELTFERSLQVEPDVMLYFFRDAEGARYVLMVADYLGDYAEMEVPYELEFDYYPGREVRMEVVEIFRRREGAGAEGYVDDERRLMVASTGDKCMLFRVRRG